MLEVRSWKFRGRILGTQEAVILAGKRPQAWLQLRQQSDEVSGVWTSASWTDVASNRSLAFRGPRSRR